MSRRLSNLLVTNTVSRPVCGFDVSSLSFVFSFSFITSFTFTKGQGPGLVNVLCENAHGFSFFSQVYSPVLVHTVQVHVVVIYIISRGFHMSVCRTHSPLIAQPSDHCVDHTFVTTLISQRQRARMRQPNLFFKSVAMRSTL